MDSGETAAGRHRQSAKGSPNEILNRLGLARLLTRLPVPSKRDSKRFLDTLHSEMSKKYSTLSQWLWQVATNQARVPKSLIPAISELYQVFDFLICQFLYPAVAGQVVVTRDPRPENWADLTAITRSLKGTQSPDDVHYEIPKRNLACSDIAISRLTLGAETTTRDNQHPGCEWLLPLSGTVSIEYAAMPGGSFEKLCTVSAPGQCAYYSSDKAHRVCNYSSEPAELFLVRFYAEDRNRYKHSGENSKSRVSKITPPKKRSARLK